jgi:hypothetical protein
MKDLIIKQTENTPEINFQGNGELLIKGVSVLENAVSFYTPIMNWLDEFEKETPDIINLVFEIEYINTATTKLCVGIVKKVYAFRQLNSNVTIIWRYDEKDLDNYDLGKDFEYWANVPIKFENL